MALIPWRRKRQALDDVSWPIETPLARFREEVDRLFERFWREAWGITGGERLGWGPNINLAETDDAVTVEAELPGLEPKDIEVRLSGNVLTISGQKKQEHEDRRRNYHYVERRFGRFQRSVRLPSSVDPDKIDAKFKNGVLTITMPKRPEAKPKRIEVRTD